MSKLMLDTSVLIDHLRNYKPATEFLETVFGSGIPAIISAVTEMELYAGKSLQNRTAEDAVQKLLELLDAVPVTSGIARRAGILLRQYRPKGLTPVDAIIASTAMEQKATLITRNTRHFRVIDGLLVFDLPAGQ